MEDEQVYVGPLKRPCPRCLKNFTYFRNLHKHLLRKFPCRCVGDEISIKDAIDICTSENFNDYSEYVNIKIEQQKTERQKSNNAGYIKGGQSAAHNSVGNDMNVAGRDVNIKKTKNVTYNQYLTVNKNALPYGQELWDDIPPAAILNAVRNHKIAAGLLLDELHKDPMNRNIALKNKTDSMCEVRADGAGWIKSSVEDVTEQLITSVACVMQGYIEQRRGKYDGKVIPKALELLAMAAESTINKALSMDSNKIRRDYQKQTKDSLFELTHREYPAIENDDESDTESEDDD